MPAAQVPGTKEKPRVAVVGGETPLGAELRDALSRSVLGGRVKLIGSEDQGAALLSEEGGEPVVITSLDGDELNAARVIFFTGSEASSRKAFPLIEKSESPRVVVDLTGALEERPDARLRAPTAEPAGFEPPAVALNVIAHPAAILVATLLRRLHQVKPIQRAVVTVFEPASERGLAGVDELHRQTVNLLSFQGLPKKVFDEQLAFNLLARYGEEAPVALEIIEQRIEKHVATLIALDPPAPMPSLRVLQAPVMHGHTVSAWIEFAGAVETADIERALDSGDFDVRGAGVATPNAVGVASQGGIAVGAIERDRNSARAVWLFAAADNFRLAAENALAVARGELIRSHAS
jgi:aspartate-semialdehyde dehydrogenase